MSPRDVFEFLCPLNTTTMQGSSQKIPCMDSCLMQLLHQLWSCTFIVQPQKHSRNSEGSLRGTSLPFPVRSLVRNNSVLLNSVSQSGSGREEDTTHEEKNGDFITNILPHPWECPRMAWTGLEQPGLV